MKILDGHEFQSTAVASLAYVALKIHCNLIAVVNAYDQRLSLAVIHALRHTWLLINNCRTSNLLKTSRRWCLLELKHQQSSAKCHCSDCYC